MHFRHPRSLLRYFVFAAQLNSKHTFFPLFSVNTRFYFHFAAFALFLVVKSACTLWTIQLSTRLPLFLHISSFRPKPISNNSTYVQLECSNRFASISTENDYRRAVNNELAVECDFIFRMLFSTIGGGGSIFIHAFEVIGHRFQTSLYSFLLETYLYSTWYALLPLLHNASLLST